MFVFVYFYFAVAFILFSFVFIFGQNFSSSSKDTDVATAAIEPNIRTIIVSLIDTGDCTLLMGTVSPINFYEVVFNSTIKWS